MRRLGRPSHSFQRTHFLEQLGAPRLDDRELPRHRHPIALERMLDGGLLLLEGFARQVSLAR